MSNNYKAMLTGKIKNNAGKLSAPSRINIVHQNKLYDDGIADLNNYLR